MKTLEPAMNIEEQIDNLKKIGLIINDVEYAKSFLNDVSYFRLIKAYSLGLKPKNSDYYKGITFKKIVQLYLFNANFRQLLFAQIEKIKVNLRCRISNYFSIKYGVLGYKDADNFVNGIYYNDFVEDMEKEINRNSKTPFVKNFKTNYENGDIPFYALVELFSFGTLSKFYKNMKNTDKKAIASSFGIGYTYLESWIENIAFVRNICAHYGRVYNVNLSKTPILYKQYIADGISNLRIFATLLCMNHILDNDNHWKDFVDQIELLFEKYPSVKPELMGFPNNWKDLLID
ncbi:MAG: Abi family protein [Ruminococcus sp.]|nr:Abi family protein [Ruminococcus sp.]